MPTRPRPLGNKAKQQVSIASAHLSHGAGLITEGLRQMDRHPDTAARQFRDARERMTMAENILLKLQLGEFSEDER